MTIDQQFVEYVIKSLVSKPDEVAVERTVDEKGVLLTLTVAPDDLGRVIGKRGTTAQSLRTLLRALGTKNDARYNLKIVDVNQPEGERPASVSREEGPSEPKEEAIEAESIPEEEPAVEETTPSETEDDHSSVVSKTRAELEEFDDMDI